FGFLVGVGFFFFCLGVVEVLGITGGYAGFPKKSSPIGFNLVFYVFLLLCVMINPVLTTPKLVFF
ncbi:hypothetical protein ACQWFZ_24590, partial [Salmonella enterica subsp. enterica serovar Infantis]